MNTKLTREIDIHIHRDIKTFSEKVPLITYSMSI